MASEEEELSNLEDEEPADDVVERVEPDPVLDPACLATIAAFVDEVAAEAVLADADRLRVLGRGRLDVVERSREVDVEDVVAVLGDGGRVAVGLVRRDGSHRRDQLAVPVKGANTTPDVVDICMQLHHSEPGACATSVRRLLPTSSLDGTSHLTNASVRSRRPAGPEKRRARPRTARSTRHGCAICWND